MRHFRTEICRPGSSCSRLVTYSENEIIKMYYESYKKKIAEAGLDPKNYSKEDCVSDWCSIHWAQEVTE